MNNLFSMIKLYLSFVNCCLLLVQRFLFKWSSDFESDIEMLRPALLWPVMSYWVQFSKQELPCLSKMDDPWSNVICAVVPECAVTARRPPWNCSTVTEWWMLAPTSLGQGPSRLLSYLVPLFSTISWQCVESPPNEYFIFHIHCFCYRLVLIDIDSNLKPKIIYVYVIRFEKKKKKPLSSENYIKEIWFLF